MLVPDIVVSELPDTAYVPEPEVGETVSVMLQLQFEPDVVQVRARRAGVAEDAVGNPSLADEHRLGDAPMARRRGLATASGRESTPAPG
jgi:hypothetical protein